MESCGDQEVAGIAYLIGQRFLAWVRSVEATDLAVEDEANRRTRSLNGLSAQRQKERLKIRPIHCILRWVSKQSFQRFSMFGFHG